MSLKRYFDLNIVYNITPAIKYLNIVIPAKAGIQEGTGCRIKSGMTELDYLVARLITAVCSSIRLTKIKSRHGGNV